MSLFYFGQWEAFPDVFCDLLTWPYFENICAFWYYRDPLLILTVPAPELEWVLFLRALITFTGK